MPEAEQIQRSIESFLASCRSPVVLEAGDPPLPVRPGGYRLQAEGERVVFQVWTDTHNVVRRVVAIRVRKPGHMEVEVERFPKRKGSLLLLDQGRAAAPGDVPRRANRMVLRERLRWFLGRQFVGWRIKELTSEAVLEHTLSPAYARATVVRDGRAWAVLAAPDETTTADHALTFGLIWLDYVRARERRLLVEGLCLLLPQGKHLTACLRIAWLNPNAARYVVFSYDSPDWEELVEVAAHGNLETEIPLPEKAQTRPPRENAAEAWLESSIRTAPEQLDARLLPAPVYGQVPAWAGIERGVLDLLACAADGRLTVLELKASADPNLPLQALDYWLRVRWHHARGDFARLGYFPGVELSPLPPRLLLAAPALEWHSTTETILRYFDPSIEVERTGLAVEWQSGFRILFRLRGAHAPK